MSSIAPAILRSGFDILVRYFVHYCLIRLMKAIVWPVATYGCVCWSWSLRKNEETRRLWDFSDERTEKNYARFVDWTAEKSMKWVEFLNKAGVKRELIDTVKARKKAYYNHTVRKQGSCLEKRDNARNDAMCTHSRKITHGLDGQHQYVDKTPRIRVNQNDRGQR